MNYDDTRFFKVDDMFTELQDGADISIQLPNTQTWVSSIRVKVNRIPSKLIMVLELVNFDFSPSSLKSKLWALPNSETNIAGYHEWVGL